LAGSRQRAKGAEVAAAGRPSSLPGRCETQNLDIMFLAQPRLPRLKLAAVGTKPEFFGESHRSESPSMPYSIDLGCAPSQERTPAT